MPEDEAQSESGQIVNASEYTDVSITRNGNMWTLDYNNGEYVGTVTSYDNAIVNKLIVRDMNWNGSGTIYIKDVVIKPKKQCIADLIYPIGSIYMSVNNVSPQALFGGIWEQIKDTFLLSSGDTYTNGSTGGSANAVIVSHSHKCANQGEYIVTSEENSANNTRVAYSASGNRWVDGQTSKSNFHHRASTSTVGKDGTGKNMPPYLAVNIWKRTA